jgi:hypothetical protein
VQLNKRPRKTLILFLVSLLVVEISIIFINWVVYSALLEASAITSFSITDTLNLSAVWLSVQFSELFYVGWFWKV